MSNNFTNNITKQVLNLRDMNQLIHELCLAVIGQSNSPPIDRPTYYQDFVNGQVIDNWGTDLYQSDNLQNQANKKGTEYFLTYQLQPNQSEGVDNCNFKLVCDFSFLMPDCNPNQKGTAKQRITRMTDLFIQSIVKNDKLFKATIQTALDSSQNLTETNKYSCYLSSSQLINRFQLNGTEQLNKTNYFTSTITIKFLITQQ